MTYIKREGEREKEWLKTKQNEKKREINAYTHTYRSMWIKIIFVKFTID